MIDTTQYVRRTTRSKSNQASSTKIQIKEHCYYWQNKTQSKRQSDRWGVSEKIATLIKALIDFPFCSPSISQLLSACDDEEEEVPPPSSFFRYIQWRCRSTNEIVNHPRCCLSSLCGYCSNCDSIRVDNVSLRILHALRDGYKLQGRHYRHRCRDNNWRQPYNYKISQHKWWGCKKKATLQWQE